MDTTTFSEKPFNIPPLTLAAGLVLTLFFLAGALLPPSAGDRLYNLLAFVPLHFTAAPAMVWFTPLTYGLLHGGWAHFGVNLLGLLAFGSGIERLLGRRWLAGLLVGGVLVGALGHWLLFAGDTTPLVGASAGISALFGGALPLLIDKRRLPMALVVFVVTNIVVGMVGVPGGQSIAWQAHLFGFFFGESLVSFRLWQAARRDKNPRPL